MADDRSLRLPFILPFYGDYTQKSLNEVGDSYPVCYIVNDSTAST
jgi:hypothetical protein